LVARTHYRKAKGGSPFLSEKEYVRIPKKVVAFIIEELEKIKEELKRR
jgi:hypothetical protein